LDIGGLNQKLDKKNGVEVYAIGKLYFWLFIFCYWTLKVEFLTIKPNNYLTDM